jgi:hypothetical protein
MDYNALSDIKNSKREIKSLQNKAKESRQKFMKSVHYPTKAEIQDKILDYMSIPYTAQFYEIMSVSKTLCKACKKFFMNCKSVRLVHYRFKRSFIVEKHNGSLHIIRDHEKICSGSSHVSVISYNSLGELFEDRFFWDMSMFLPAILLRVNATLRIQRIVRRWLGQPTYKSGRKGLVFRKAEKSYYHMEETLALNALSR